MTEETLATPSLAGSDISSSLSTVHIISGAHRLNSPYQLAISGDSDSRLYGVLMPLGSIRLCPGVKVMIESGEYLPVDYLIPKEISRSQLRSLLEDKVLCQDVSVDWNSMYSVETLKSYGEKISRRGGKIQGACNRLIHKGTSREKYCHQKRWKKGMCLYHYRKTYPPPHL
jgi:hypothetical protein